MADEGTNLGQGSKPGSTKNPLLTILVLLNTVMMLGIAYFQYQTHVKVSSTPTVQDIVKKVQESQNADVNKLGQVNNIEKDGILIPLEGFTANLAQGDGPRRFVRLNAVLRFSDRSSQEEINARKPQIRDVIISSLNSKRAEDLLRVEGKNFLKEELKSAINAFMVDGEVEDIFYVDFQVN